MGPAHLPLGPTGTWPTSSSTASRGAGHALRVVPLHPAWPSAPITPSEGGDLVSSPHRTLSAPSKELGLPPPPASITAGEVWGPRSLPCPGRGPLPQDSLLLSSPRHRPWVVLWAQPEGPGTSLDLPVGRCLPWPSVDGRNNWSLLPAAVFWRPPEGGPHRHCGQNQSLCPVLIL